ncbi:spermine oxidase-like [Palaemon carinicauda]|uniref:spermine oxidase-like n=1 Tax=Palaemon carinicauda TaxID=392227 RepID=UPI0035B5E7C1
MRLERLRLLLPPLLTLLFGISEASHPCDQISGSYNDWSSNAISKEVVVVGGGIAGLAAMKTFMENQVPNAVLLEAQDYLGGRVKTHREGSILVEDGAEWINGGSSNRLYGLAQSLGFLTQPLQTSDYDWRTKTSEGDDANAAGYDVANEVFNECEEDSVKINYRETGYGQCYLDRFPNWYDNGLTSPDEKAAWENYLHMWVLKDTGTNTWMDVSGRDADHFTDWGEDKWNQWSQGFDALTNHLKSSIPQNNIKTSTPVCKIFWDSDPVGKVLVVTATQEAYLADYVLVTASVGHLKDRHFQLFDPPLPSNYQNNLNNIELGVADKVQLGWQEPWWDTTQKKPLNLHIIFKNFNLPAEQSWLYGIMEFLSIHQQTNMLQAFVTGDKARQMENMSSEEVKEHLLSHLRRVTGQDVPEPTLFRRTQWEKNVWMKGSYNSYIPVTGDAAGLTSREPLAKPISNSQGVKVIHWAGEHTSNTRYGTVDGAMDSGETAAFAIIDDMDTYY